MAPTSEPAITIHAKPGSLKDELAAALPAGFRCKARYVHTAPKRCEPIFSTPPGSEPEFTRLASHFLTVSIHSGSETAENKDVLVFGVEALMYSTKRLTTIFVSKADSTGYLTQQRPSPVKLITTTFIHWLARKERHKHLARKLVISLFARSQSQYLFPGSAENANKHVLDDRQLIKWWVRVLDVIFPEQPIDSGTEETQLPEYNGYITVPGYEGMMEHKAFLPPYNQSAGVRQHWFCGNPLNELAQARGVRENAPTRCLLPRFPDDPKALFMQDLDDEAGISEDTPLTISPSNRKESKWTSIRDLERFWEAMGFRQECSSGRLVGFLWLVIGLQRSHKWSSPRSDLKSPSEISTTEDFNKDSLAKLPNISTNGNSPAKTRRKPLSGPIISRQPRLKGGSSSMTASDLSGMLDVEVDNGLVLTKDGYDKAMHTMLHLDFANLEVAIQSTKKWVSEVSQICNIQADWALDITGTAKIEFTAREASSNGNTQSKAINDLGGMVRKKRKAEDQAVSGGHVAADVRLETAGQEKPAINVLNGGVLRKKAKPAVG